LHPTTPEAAPENRRGSAAPSAGGPARPGRPAVAAFLSLVAAAALAAGCGPSDAPAPDAWAARVPDQEIVVGNDRARRVLQVRDGRVHTVRFEGPEADAALTVEAGSPEFTVLFSSGRRATSEAFSAVGIERTYPGDLADGDARSGLPDGRPVACVLTLEGPGRWTAVVRYEARDLHPAVCKHLRLVPPTGADDRLLEVEVERLAVGAGVAVFPEVPREITGERQSGPDLRYRGGLGLGQPLYLNDRIFTGLEHPGGANTLEQGVVSLRQFPGMRLSVLPPEGFSSETAVWGLCGEGEAVPGFRAYLKRRIRPPVRQRNFIDAFHLRGRANIGVGINDFPSPEELEQMYADHPELRHRVRTEENAVAYARSTADFAVRYGVEMDSFAVDGGWQDPRTVFEIDDYFLPGGFHPLTAAAGLPLGLWNSLAGFRLDLDFLSRERGFQVCPPIRFSFDLSQPAYLEAIQGAVRSLAEEYAVAYWKQDFNAVVCNLETPQHPAEDAQSFEANVNALIRIVGTERDLNPEVFIAQTTFIWPSPWWLLHVDAVPSLVADYGYLRTFPAFHPRDWHTSFVDAAQYGFFGRDRSQYPTSRVMTHGIIHDRYVHVGGDREALSSWANGVVAHLAPGPVLQELYVDPDMLPASHAWFLSHALRWVDAREAQLFDFGEMFGGDPARGEPYGFLHGPPGERIAFVRNPTGEPRHLEIPFLAAPGATRALLLYPYLELLPEPAGGEASLRVDLGPYEVRVLETVPADRVPPWMAPGAVYGALGEETLRVFRRTGEDPPPARPVRASITPARKGVVTFVPDGARARLTLILNEHEGTEGALTRTLRPLPEQEAEVNRGPCGPLGCPLIHIEAFRAYRIPLPPGTFHVGWTLDPDTTVHAVWLETEADRGVEELPVDPGAVLFPTPGLTVERSWTLLFFQGDEEPVEPLLPEEPLRGDLEIAEFVLTAPIPAAIDVGDKAGGAVLVPLLIDPEGGRVFLEGTGATVDGRATGGTVELTDIPAVGTVTLGLADYQGTYDPATGAMEIPMDLGLEAPAFALRLDLSFAATTGRATASIGEAVAEAHGHVLTVERALRLAGAGQIPPGVPLLGGQPFAVTLSGRLRASGP